MNKLCSITILSLLPFAAAANDTLSVYNWSDYISPDTIQNFTERTGIKVQYDVFDTNEALDAKLSVGGSGYDVVFPSNHFMARQIQSGALKRIDHAKLSNWSNLNPVLLKVQETYDPGNQYGFPYLWGTTGIGYNQDKVREVLGQEIPLDSWDLLFKPEYSQKLSQCGISVLDNSLTMFSIALNYLGLPPHSKNPPDYEITEKLLMETRHNIRYFHSSKYITDLANDDICMAVGYSGDILQAMQRAQQADNRVIVGYAIPREGGPLWFDMVAMPVDTPNEQAAYVFMNYLLEPKVIADISNHVHYANANTKADPLIDPTLKENYAVYPPEQIIDSRYLQENMPLPIERLRNRLWNRIKSGL